MLLGITKASLSTSEFYFPPLHSRKLPKYLLKPHFSGKSDYLRGLKENVIMGRLITAGTGLVMYRKLGIKIAADNSEMNAE